MTRAPAPPLAAVALLSAAALGYEVLLLRLFSIVQWHHFAYMIISLALLGYGVSGTVLALLGERAGRHFETLFMAAASLFGAAAVGCFLAAQRVPFNPLELLWDASQPARLAAIYLVLAVPFLFAATGIGLAFVRFRDRIGRVYGADLLGAGGGALGVLGLLFVAMPMDALSVIGALGPVAAALAAGQARRWGPMVAAAALAAGLAVLPAGTLGITPYKGLSQTLETAGARVLSESSSPLGLLTVVDSPRIPFRHAPGLSLASPVGPPEQLGVFTDGDAYAAINRSDPGGPPPGHFAYLTSALPYALRQDPRVLVLGAGVGGDVLQALGQGAAAVDAVEINRQMADLVRGTYAEFAGRPFDRPGVRLHIAEARGFVTASGGGYDIIQVALLDAFGSASAGLHALNESYLYTVEALGLYLDRLADGGLLAVTRWVKLPPRDGLKLLATAAAALRRAGIEEPGRHLALIRGWKTSTLLVRDGPFTAAEAAAVRRFCVERSFDLAWLPDMTADEANRFTVLDQPYFFDGATALLGPDAASFTDRYKYDIRPATDDRPYFFNAFKWRLLPELTALRGRGGLGLLEWGYPVLVATLAQAAVAAVLLIAVPLWLTRRAAAGHAGRGRVLVYFLGLGFAFLFVEMAFIQKFILFLNHPIYAAAAVLSAFLVFAGLGSLVSARLPGRNPAAFAIAAIAMIALTSVFVLPPILAELAAIPLPARFAVSMALIAPLAFCMGMPFPAGLARLGQGAPALIPWAWAINGCASVLGAVLATVIAIEVGFTAVILAAVALYGVAAASFPRPEPP